jgi:hypothetical protein
LQKLLFSERVHALDCDNAFRLQLRCGDVDVHLAQPSELADLSVGQRLAVRVFPQDEEYVLSIVENEYSKIHFETVYDVWERTQLFRPSETHLDGAKKAPIKDGFGQSKFHEIPQQAVLSKWMASEHWLATREFRIPATTGCSLRRRSNESQRWGRVFTDPVSRPIHLADEGSEFKNTGSTWTQSKFAVLH